MMEQSSTQIHNIGWRVPNGIFISLSWLVTALTWFMLIYIYPSLPASIPTHFGISGQADASSVKNFWNVFLPAIIQLVLVALTWWLSHHPQYSNLPSTLTIKLAPEPTQSIIKRLLAHMLVMTGLITSLIMAYISLGMVQVSLGVTDRLSVWAILGLVAMLLLIIGVYTGWLMKLTRHLPADVIPERPLAQ